MYLISEWECATKNQGNHVHQRSAVLPIEDLAEAIKPKTSRKKPRWPTGMGLIKALFSFRVEAEITSGKEPEVTREPTTHEKDMSALGTYSNKHSPSNTIFRCEPVMLDYQSLIPAKEPP